MPNPTRQKHLCHMRLDPRPPKGTDKSRKISGQTRRDGLTKTMDPLTVRMKPIPVHSKEITIWEMAKNSTMAGANHVTPETVDPGETFTDENCLIRIPSPSM